jgi:hypothetical protein
MRVFKLGKSCHGNHCIEAHDLTEKECILLRRIVCNNYISSYDYQALKPTNAFLQGFEPPSNGYNRKNGWVLVEFWTDNMPAINKAIEHINQEFAES